MLIIKLIDLIVQNCGVGFLITVGIIAGVCVVGALHGQDDDESTVAELFTNDYVETESEAIAREEIEREFAAWSPDGYYTDRYGNRRNVYHD